MNFVFPATAIERFRRVQFDPKASMEYELISGSIVWSDEEMFEIAAVCRSVGCNYYAYPFAYRTSVLLGRPDDKFKFAWDELKSRCPEWIGFRLERNIPDPRFEQFVKREEEWA